MKKVPLRDGGIDAEARAFRSLTGPLGTEGVAINYYERAPGECVRFAPGE